MKAIKGTGVALVTPFNEDYSVDHESLAKLVDHQCENGTDYLVILGTTGESPVVSKKEKQEIIETVKKANKGRLPLVLGMGSNNTLDLINELKNLDTEGLTAILSVSPYYNKPNQEGIYRHYMAVADASPLPVILYNVPGRTGANMTAETTLKLAKHPNICAVKEASGNFSQCMEIIQHKAEDFVVISGDDAFTLPFIAMGMEGVISVICNAYPRKFSDMIDRCMQGDFESAKTLHYELLDQMNLIFADGSPSGIKIILNELGICKTFVKPPLYEVNEKVKNMLIEANKKLN